MKLCNYIPCNGLHLYSTKLYFNNARLQRLYEGENIFIRNMQHIKQTVENE